MGDLPRGTISIVSKTFKVHRATLKTIWGRHISGDTIGNKRSLSGRAKSIKLMKKIEDELPTINIEKRSSIISLAYQLNIPRITEHYAVSKGYIKCINNKVKPCLNTKQKINRVKFCISHLDLPNQMFIPFNNLIHIDEKWFYMNQISRKVYQSPHKRSQLGGVLTKDSYGR